MLAYAPPGFGLGALLRSALEERGLTYVVVTPPVAPTDLLAEHPDLAVRGSVVVVDDPDGVVGPQEAARLESELGHVALVVLGHAARPAWEIHRTSTVVPPSELLATSSGAGGSAQSTHDLGGWPSLVALVGASRSEPVPAEVTAHLRRRWWPHVPPAWVPTLVALVAAGGLQVAERSALPGIEPAVLDELLDLTVLRPTHDGGVLELVPALAQVVHDSLPADVESARHAVARARERLGTGDCGLGAAAARSDWASCARILDRWWPELVFGGRRALVQQVVLDAPDGALRQHAALALRAEYLGRLPVGTVPFSRIRPRSPLAQLAVDESGITALRRTVVAMIGRRVHGHLAEARRIALSAERLADACRTADLGPTAAATPFWYLHAGLSCHLAGDSVAANRMYRKGWQLRERADLPFVARDLALKTAVLRATDGRTSEAQWWLERAQQEPAVGGVAGSYADVTEQAARLLLALDSADLEGFDRVWRDVGDSYVRDEMWPFMVSAIVGRRLAGGDVSGARRALAEVHDIYPATSAAGGLHTRTMTLLSAEASLAAGRPGRARSETDGLPAVPAVQAFRALVAVVSGDAHESLRLVAAVDDSSASERDRLRLALVSAVAHRRLGDDRLAGETMEKAASAAHWTQFPMALATVPRADVEALAEHAPTAAALLRTLDERGIHALVPETVELVRLSDRERAVLQALVDHGSNEKIAQALFVSVNTVKTQLRSIYGKLGVSSRREAVVAAHAMGLLEGRAGERTDR